MNQDVYNSLSPKEKMIYDELVSFTHKMGARLDALTQATMKLLEEATKDP